MLRLKRLILSVLSGILLAIPWYESLPNITIFISLVPLLLLHDDLLVSNVKWKIVVFYSSLSFMIWVALSAWWLYNATLFGLIMAILIASFLMTLAFMAFHFTRKVAGDRIGFFSFPVYWITYEIFFHNAELQWPWLTLGNGIGDNIRIIQWYEYTGVFGGSLWILLINLLIYFIYKVALKKDFKKIVQLVILLLAISITPIVVSKVIYGRYIEKINPANVIIIQPSIDPYNEKFSGLSNEQQMDIMFKLAEENIDNRTDYVICPETAIDGSIWESEISSNPSIVRVKNFVFGHPKVKWVTGMSSYKMYKPGDKITYTCREYPYEKGFYYDYFNSAIQIDTTDNYPIYHKSKLVAGVEMMPYPKQLKLLEKLSIDLGGISGHAGTQSTRDVFYSFDKKFGAAPVICYESDFGEYMSGYIKNGANLIFVMTNDGWWGNTPGHRQHLTFSQIRAIELRRSIARSANTGISAIINQKGEVVESLSWWKRGVIKGTINANSQMTFYARTGDYIGKFATYLAIFIFLFTIIRRITIRKA